MCVYIYIHAVCVYIAGVRRLNVRNADEMKTDNIKKRRRHSYVSHLISCSISISIVALRRGGETLPIFPFII